MAHSNVGNWRLLLFLLFFLKFCSQCLFQFFLRCWGIFSAQINPLKLFSLSRMFLSLFFARIGIALGWNATAKVWRTSSGTTSAQTQFRRQSKRLILTSTGNNWLHLTTFNKIKIWLQLKIIYKLIFNYTFFNIDQRFTSFNLCCHFTTFYRNRFTS